MVGNTKTIAIAGILALIIIGGLYFYFSISNKGSSATQVATKTESLSDEKVPSTQLKQYTDSSGFSFSYPVDLEIQKAEELDNITYSDLSIDSPEVEGSINVKVTDTKLATLDAWVKSTKESSVKTTRTKLGLLEAMEIVSDSKTTLGAIDQGILFLVTVSHPDQSTYWQSIYSSIRSSFAFAAPQAATTGSSDQAVDSGIDFEGEEIIE